MKRNTNRILTMHAGSLARPPDLREMVLAKSNGQPYDAEALARRLRSAVAEVVQQQIAVGLDSINDGEFSKTNFTNYARERLSGHEERSGAPGNPLARIYGRDAQEFPEYFAGRGNLGGREVVCTGPLTFKGHAAIQTDIDNFAEGAQLATKQLWG
jgi:5-methyltetrahydropteroyltriglutamate--homocysteine methyltransferase